MPNDKSIKNNKITYLYKKEKYKEIVSLKNIKFDELPEKEKEMVIKAYYYQNLHEPAIKLLSNVVSPALIIFKARLYATIGNTKSAIDLLNHLDYGKMELKDKVEYNLTRGDIYSNNLDQKNALKEMDKAMKLLEKNNVIQNQFYSVYRYLGIIYIRLNKFKMARNYCQRVIENKDADPQDKGFTYRYLGIIHSFKYNYFDAIIYFNKALSLFREHNNTLGLMKTYTSISLSYINMGELEIGLFFAKKGLELAKVTQDHLSESKIYNRLGNLYILKNKYDTALEYFKKDYDYTSQLENPILKGYSARNIGRLYKLQNDNINAEKYLKESLNIFKTSSDIFNQLLIKMEMLSLNINNKHYETLEEKFNILIKPLIMRKFEEMIANFYLKFSYICEEKKRYNKALNYIKRSLDIFKRKENIFRYVEALFHQGKIYYLLNNKQKALDSLTECYNIMKSKNIAFLFQSTVDLMGMIDEELLIKTSKEKAISIEEEKYIKKLNKINIISEFQNYYIIGKSKVLKELVKKAEKLAKTDVNILIEGETGIGKEIFAKYIYYKSNRWDKAFMPINCGGIPDTLWESELFGYKSGAFTGAIKDRLGKIKAANGGVVFLDEIDKTTKRGQTLLLRFLEEKEIYPVGSEFPEKVDVRVIFAANVDLMKLIEEDKFLPDLYYRISTSNIKIPPLRERKEDISELINYYIKKYSGKYGKKIDGISNEAMKLLLSHKWPGNIRELKNNIENMIILCENKTIEVKDIILNRGIKTFLPLEEYEHNYIKDVLRFTKGNKVKAAKILGIHRNSLNNKLKNNLKKNT